MTKYWISWYYKKEDGAFEIHSPWWFTSEDTICAAIQTDMLPEKYIQLSYDKPPENIKFRFVDKKADDWSPFSDRFQKAGWMKWK